jgi:hypothetical protein
MVKRFFSPVGLTDMDITIVFIYFVALILIGTRSFGFIKGINSFFVAKRAGSLLSICGK